MLSKRRCPRTGIVNFYSRSDPHIAIGSVVKAGNPGMYEWRSYLGDHPGSGVASHLRLAEGRLRRQLHEAARDQGLDSEPDGRLYRPALRNARSRPAS